MKLTWRMQFGLDWLVFGTVQYILIIAFQELHCRDDPTQTGREIRKILVIIWRYTVKTFWRV
jgi:hypothetical protein